MQRWIVLGALVLCLLGGGLVFGYWKYKQNLPDRRWVPLPFNPETTEKQREESVAAMRERLLTDAVLTGLVRDCDVQGRWKLPTEEAAVAELKERVFVEGGEMSFNGVPAQTMNIGFKGKAGDAAYLDRLSERLMDDVKRLIAPHPQPESAIQPAGF